MAAEEFSLQDFSILLLGGNTSGFGLLLVAGKIPLAPVPLTYRECSWAGTAFE